MRTGIKKQTMSDAKKRFYDIGNGFWASLKTDGKFAYLRGKEGNGAGALGPLPGWTLRQNPPRLLGQADLKELCGLPMSERGMLETLSRYGPWDVPADARGPLTENFESWRWEAIEVRRAYFLVNLLRKGEVPSWATARRAGEFFLRIISWPRPLQMAQEPKDWMLSLSGPIDGPRGRVMNRLTAPSAVAADELADTDAARTFAKELLAQYINHGLREIPMGFVFDRERDAFRTDTDDVTMSLRQACWLIIRDLAAGLSGVRFCHAPGCRNEIPATKNAHCKVCSPNCQQAFYRYRKGKGDRNGSQG